MVFRDNEIVTLTPAVALAYFAKEKSLGGRSIDPWIDRINRSKVKPPPSKTRYISNPSVAEFVRVN